MCSNSLSLNFNDNLLKKVIPFIGFYCEFAKFQFRKKILDVSKNSAIMLMKKFYVDVIFTDDIACYGFADKHEYSGNLNTVVAFCYMYSET